LVPRWIPGGSAEEAAMLAELGLTNSEELFADIPRKVRLGRMGVGAGKDELDVVRAVDKILDRNRPYSKFSAFLGGRLTLPFAPAAVDAILSRSEFYTSYTPYQPEASQGMLQSLFEFQSLWVELSGMDAANASLYDGATAAGEALLLCRRIHEGRRFLIPASLPWEEKSVLANYAAGFDVQLSEIPADPRTGLLDLAWIRTAVAGGDVFGLLADLPNGYGHLDEGLPDLKSILGKVPLVIVADPLALSVIEPPGNWGADIVVAEGQGFGIPASFGGPLVGLFACRREHLRFSPGRIVGATKDAEGRRAFTLTLQTREQHIRRSRATSNICTNQSLIALAFVVYASTVGFRGLADLQTRLSEKAHTLAAALANIEGLSAPRFEAPYLSSFTLGLSHGSPVDFLDRLRRRRVLGGHPLSDPRPGAPPAEALVLTAVNQMTEDRDIQKFAKAARAIVPGLRSPT
ncbi:MAG: aminomethyl-transferring glycine dehydrogenase subunit GcvPA, partial [Thermoplasmata archaeon]|nr:aminomethyl-transferring glycine dehydrogenase subunit GcvPA [Thermoplasmata archaeon]